MAQLETVPRHLYLALREEIAELREAVERTGHAKAIHDVRVRIHDEKSENAWH